MATDRNDEESPLEELEERLYAQEDVPRSRRSRLHGKDNALPRDWQHEHDLSLQDTISDRSLMARSTTKNKFARIFLLSSIVFFVIAVGIAAWVVGRGGNTVSSSNFEIAVAGPVALDAGETLSLAITLTNSNNATLETADLLVEFPSGTRDPEDIRVEQQRLRESLGDIRAGEIVKHTAKGVVFGEAGDEQQVVVSVEYRLAGSNAIFVKEKAFSYVIEDTPLSLRVEGPSEVNAGQAVETVLTVTSNSTNVLEDIVVAADYPFGFSFLEASPEPSQGNQVWSIGDLPPGGRQVVRVRGIFEGQDGEERTMRFTAGVADPEDEFDIATPLLALDHTFMIERPFIDVVVAINGDTDGDVVVGSGEQIRADITYRNNLTTQVANLELELVLDGDALDRSSVSVNRGFYRSSTDTITWNRETDSRLALINPGESGQVSFTFSPERGVSEGELQEPEMYISGNVSAERRGESSSLGDIQSVLDEQVIRVYSDLALSSAALHFDGPLNNSGPMPPEADTETTYTVVWKLSNSSNAASDVRVSATLPSYVRWVGVVDPVSETVNYSDVGGEVVWDVGTVAAGTGHTGSDREVAFQIALTPSLSQVGSSPTLLSGARVTGIDSFTGTTLEDITNSLTTRLTEDNRFRETQGRVVE